MSALENMRANRAFIAGAAAQNAGAPAVAPEKMGEFKIDWMRGWNGALATSVATAGMRQTRRITVRGAPT